MEPFICLLLDEDGHVIQVSFSKGTRAAAEEAARRWARQLHGRAYELWKDGQRVAAAAS